jgi:hypothetical protein
MRVSISAAVVTALVTVFTLHHPRRLDPRSRSAPAPSGSSSSKPYKEYTAISLLTVAPTITKTFKELTQIDID